MPNLPKSKILPTFKFSNLQNYAVLHPTVYLKFLYCIPLILPHCIPIFSIVNLIKIFNHQMVTNELNFNIKLNTYPMSFCCLPIFALCTNQPKTNDKIAMH